ncbi:MAG: hypothetical protein ACLUS6_10490 [Dysosmobacter sp.]
MIRALFSAVKRQRQMPGEKAVEKPENDMLHTYQTEKALSEQKAFITNSS